eukprot:1121154_1
MKAIVALLLGVAMAWDMEYTLDEVHNMDTVVTFKSWAEAFGKTYDDTEVAAKRYMVWLDNLYKIAKTNSEDLSYKLALNQFSDLNGDEFREYVHGKDGRCFKSDEQDYIVNRGGQDVIVEEFSEPAPAPHSVDRTTKPQQCPQKKLPL